MILCSNPLYSTDAFIQYTEEVTIKKHARMINAVAEKKQSKLITAVIKRKNEMKDQLRVFRNEDHCIRKCLKFLRKSI